MFGMKSIILGLFMILALLQLSVNAQAEAEAAIGRFCTRGSQVCNRFDRNSFFRCVNGRFIFRRCPPGFVCVNAGFQRIRCVRRRF
ncbi:hypothetical protein BB559_001341 [Furculomyces boomerangus]|uniref:Chitin-binding type-2 domain-containing protein n=2 Tax=Harpellales TaxID=61421 RepID=A0A2T9Z2B1_9FUNG|nr:hypothetical protein BB559_001341 [Furculomyces boomerangus]PVZ97216.1 hypothetical protein BB558_006832 [Smittium angustum]PVZ99042.1 hypothetical protein BB558_004950 [Smittium angustum]